MGGKTNGKPRNRSPTRGVQRVKSKSSKDALQHRSKSREGRGRGRRASSRDPGSREFKTRGLSSTRGSRGSSAESPVRRPPGRTSSSSGGGGRKPPGRTSSSSGGGGRKPPNRTQSFGLERGRKPPNRTQSFGLERGRKPPARSRSAGLDKGLGAHQQKLRRARSASPSLRVRNRSASKERIQRTRGRSHDPAYRKSRSRSSSSDRFDDEIVRKKSYPSQKPEDNGISRRRLGKSFKRIKQIGGRSTKECTWWQLCNYIIPIGIILGASVGLMFATGNGSFVTDAIDNLINTFDNSELQDPFGGGKAPHWPTDGNGLRVTIISALTPDWQTTFQLATADWSYGEPNAVQILTESGTPNKDCEAPDGFVAVCNGNYGDLKWRGVNEVMLNPRGQMLSSTARMNEYYLANMEDGAWQYTMCHELGHTLGLGHTDENFDNKDLGNCMDYTDNLNANKHPDRGNYEKLLSIYGPIAQDIPLRQRQLRGDDTLGRQQDYRVPTAADAPVVRDSSPSDPLPAMSVHYLRRRDPWKNDQESHLETKDHDSSVQGAVDIATAVTTVPDHIRDKKNAAVQKLYQRMKDYYNSQHETNDSKMQPVGHTHHDGWKLVHRVRHGEEHEAELGEGYKVRVQFLLVH